MNANTPAVIAPAAQSTALIHYDAMCRAIAEAHAVDEVKDIRDKALALEMYARLAQNVEAEAQACEIRLRAERRAGQLLRDMEKLRGRPEKASPATTLSDLGVSRDQSSKWQKLASIAEDDFEASLAKPKASTTGIIAEHEDRDPIDKRGLWLWGRLKDFEREGVLDADPEALFENMLPHMQDTTLDLVPRVIAWLERLPK